MPWTSFVSMELDDEDQLDACLPIPCEKPRFPYGLRICLTHAELMKLKLDADCDVGDVVDLRAFAVVTSKSISQDEHNGEQCRIELQIEKLAVLDESHETMETD